MTDDRCARCGLPLITMRYMTTDYRPLCDFCPLGMDPETYVSVGSETDQSDKIGADND